MSYTKVSYPADKQEFYQQLKAAAEALTGNVPHLIANLSNLAALLGSAMKEINWVGFYLIPARLPEYFPLKKIKGREERLVVGPFQGLPACIEIPLGRGVCGTAALKDEIQLVEDVHVFPGHIACDSASNSEIVLPIHDQTGVVVGVLDIDSPVFARFDEMDKQGLQEIVKVIETFLQR